MFSSSPAYRAGYSANYLGGVSIESNPYTSGTTDFHDWRKGWLESDADHGSI